MEIREIKLGSLFSGSGGFELAGTLCGIKPVFCSEIEPFPIRVEAARFPDCKQLGDVTKINGAEIEPVDIITFGSPCQDLSVAGKQAGIHEGQRSNLFFEAIRIIKEMRNHDELDGRTGLDIRPRFAVWENVPGAFSSGKGKDFQAVLQAFCNVRGGANIHVPLPQNGKWQPAGCIVGDGYSVAWRVYDAQYWGVPQRRKRIYLIADFATERAGEILFKPESMRGYPAPCSETGKGTPSDAEGSAGGSRGAWCLKGNFIDRNTHQNGIGWNYENAYTLDSTDRHGVSIPNRGGAAGFKGKASPCARGIGYEAGVAPTLIAGQEAHCVYAWTYRGRDGGCNVEMQKDTSYALREPSGGGSQPNVCYATQGVCVQNTGRGWWNEGPVAETLRTPCGGDSTKANLVIEQVVYPEVARTLTARHDSSPCIDRGGQIVCTLDCRNLSANYELSATLACKPEGGWSLNYQNPVVYSADSFGSYREGTGTLRASGGDVEGGYRR